MQEVQIKCEPGTVTEETPYLLNNCSVSESQLVSPFSFPVSSTELHESGVSFPFQCDGKNWPVLPSILSMNTQGSSKKSTSMSSNTSAPDVLSLGDLYQRPLLQSIDVKSTKQLDGDQRKTRETSKLAELYLSVGSIGQCSPTGVTERSEYVLLNHLFIINVLIFLYSELH